jgi:uncharacterized DUF497 family protein/uncharacterized protein (DUF4415 family)
VEFEWDGTKAEANLRKPKVSFRKASEVFDDLARLDDIDASQSHGEDRWVTIGRVEDTLLTVIYTQRNDRIRLISARRQPIMSKNSTGLVTFRREPGKPVVLTPEEKKLWEQMKNMREEDIDLSDIPDQGSKTGWRRISDLVPEQNKQQVTLRLDADLLAFFKSTGRRYQSRINAVLREYMNANKAS